MLFPIFLQFVHKKDWTQSMKHAVELQCGPLFDKIMFNIFYRIFHIFLAYEILSTKIPIFLIFTKSKSKKISITQLVVVVYHVTIVAIGHGLLKKFWPLVLGCVLRTAGSSIVCNYSGNGACT